MTMKAKILDRRRKFHFREVETNMHLYAKKVLHKWIENEYLKVIEEYDFCMNGIIWFKPDVVCFSEKGVEDIFEVVYTNDISYEKKMKMLYYFARHEWDVNVYTISAEWIMKQTKKPEELQLKKVI